MGALVLRNGTRVPNLVSQLRNTLWNVALTTKTGIFTLCSFAADSQLRNGGSCSAKWHSCAKLGFAASKIFAEATMELRNDFAKDGRFRRETSIPQRLLLGCEMALQRSANFAEAAKSRRPLFLLYFHSVFGSIFSFQFLYIFSHLRSFKKIKLHIETYFKIKN